MKNESTRSLKKLTKSTVRLYQEIALILIIFLAAVIGGYSFLKSKAAVAEEIKNATVFDPFATSAITNDSEASPDYEYSELEVYLLSDSFAISADKKIEYFIAVDENYYPCIVALKSDSMEEYQELIDYTYSDSTEDPPVLVLKGYPEALSYDLKQFAIDGINIFYDDTIASPANIKEIVGTLCLNTAQEPAGNYLASTICILGGGLAVILLGILISADVKNKKRLGALAAQYSAQELMSVDEELNQPSTLCLNSENLYITANYLISKKPELDIIPMKEITQVYGFNDIDFLNARQGVVAITLGGVKHKITLSPAENKFNSITDQIVERLKSKFPDIQYGFGTSFYTTDASAGEDPATGKSSNLWLGILGAIIGAALGSILWVFLGVIGYISGLAGLLMIILAFKGYSLLSGYLDRKGQIISAIIALLMLFAANYTTYVFAFCKASKTWGISDIIEAFQTLPAFMTANDLWHYFFKDLAIGLVLSLIVIAFSMNSKKKPKKV